MSGRPRKRPGQGTKPRKALALVPVSPQAEPPPLQDSAEMLPGTRAAWTDFWRSPVAGAVVVSSDLPALTRLFHLADELERCRVEFPNHRLVAGSQGQPVMNPLGAFMLALAKEVRALEDRFGASVVSRLRVSIDLGSAAESLDEMNARLLADESDGDE